MDSCLGVIFLEGTYLGCGCDGGVVSFQRYCPEMIILGSV